MNKISKDIKLYNSFLHSMSISYTNLLDKGLTPHDIKNYLSDGRLIKNSYGNYSITGEAILSLQLVDSIFNHTEIDFESTLAMRRNCLFSIREDFMPLCGLMLYDLEKRNFDDFLSDLRLINSISSNKIDYYLDTWYFLTSYICNLNDKETEHIRNILDNKKFYSKSEDSKELIFDNNFREALFRHDFYSCYEALNVNSKDNILDLITCCLLRSAFIKEAVDNDQLYELIDSATYDEALELLKDKNSKSGLSYNDKLFYIALDDLDRLINDDMIPVVNASVNNPIIGDYISSGNYKEALNILKGASVTRNDKYLLKVLETINEEIKRVEESKSKDCNKSSDSLKHDGNVFDEVIENVLKEIDCKYRGIIYDLVFINYLEGKIECDDICNYVNGLIDNGSIFVDVNSYIINFYKAIENNSTEVAILYLDIIDRVNSIDKLNIDISLLQKDMVNSMESLNNAFYSTIASISNGDRSIAISDNVSPVVGSSILMLNLDDYNVKSSLIRDGDDTRVVFRYFNNDLSIDCNMEDADNFYFNGMYDDAISIYERIFAVNEDFNHDLLVRTGLSYYATDRLDEAIEYLFLADYYGKRDDFKPLIDSYRNKLNYNGIPISKDIDKFIRRKTYIKVKES